MRAALTAAPLGPPVLDKGHHLRYRLVTQSALSGDLARAVPPDWYFFMRLTALQVPASQERLFAEFKAFNNMRTAPCLSSRWQADAWIDVGSETPIVWLHNGHIELSWSPLGLAHAPGAGVTHDATAKMIGRRCLVPVAAARFETPEGPLEQRPSNREFVLLGAMWRPIGNYGFEPESIALLTARGDDGVEGLIVVPPNHWAAWLDANSDTTPLHVPAAEWTVSSALAP